MPEARTNQFSGLDLSIDRDGRWRHEDQEITHPGLLAALYNALQRIDGGYFVCAENLCVPVKVADCPYAALSVRHYETHVELLLTDGRHVALAPETLTLDAANVPRCAIDPDGMPVRFTRAAWLQLAEAIEETADGSFALAAGGKPYPIRFVE